MNDNAETIDAVTLQTIKLLGEGFVNSLDTPRKRLAEDLLMLVAEVERLHSLASGWQRRAHEADESRELQLRIRHRVEEKNKTIEAEIERLKLELDGRESELQQTQVFLAKADTEIERLQSESEGLRQELKEALLTRMGEQAERLGLE